MFTFSMGKLLGGACVCLKFWLQHSNCVAAGLVVLVYTRAVDFGTKNICILLDVYCLRNIFRQSLVKVSLK